MDIIEKLKKERKIRSVFDVIRESKETKETLEEKTNDIEVRELNPAQPVVSEPNPSDTESTEEKPVREFRTDGMQEFDIDSLGAGGDASTRLEYKARISQFIDTGQIDEAIELLNDLKSRLTKNE
jgi:hypothetical protein